MMSVDVGFPYIVKLENKKDNKNKNLQGNKKNIKRAIFSYVGHKTKTITKLFKDANIDIAYKTQNTI
jgi:hypothetical protein